MYVRARAAVSTYTHAHTHAHARTHTTHARMRARHAKTYRTHDHEPRTRGPPLTRRSRALSEQTKAVAKAAPRHIARHGGGRRGCARLPAHLCWNHRGPATAFPRSRTVKSPPARRVLRGHEAQTGRARALVSTVRTVCTSPQRTAPGSVAEAHMCTSAVARMRRAQEPPAPAPAPAPCAGVGGACTYHGADVGRVDCGA